VIHIRVLSGRGTDDRRYTSPLSSPFSFLAGLRGPTSKGKGRGEKGGRRRKG